MTLLPSFWDLLRKHGYEFDNPRPRLDPQLEQTLEEEAEDEEALGEKEPDAVPEFSPNVRLVHKGGGRAILYAVQCTLRKGFWGVRISDVAELSRQPLPWALVLLHGNATTGYWFSAGQVREFAASTWQPILPGSPHYEVVEPDNLARARPIRSEDDLINLVAALTGTGRHDPKPNG
jgi:hypothetical protein